MQPTRIAPLALGLALCCVSSALSETRAVALVLKREKEKGTLVTIYSDVKKEKTASISLDDAVKLVEQMQGWGSAVLVCIVADNAARTNEVVPVGDLRKLLKAVDENAWLSLVYLRVGEAKSGDDMLEHIIQATGGKR